MNYLIEYNSGSRWFEYGPEKNKTTAIELARTLEANGGGLHWPYRVKKEETGQVIWPPVAIQSEFEIKL